jgi:hypothetical protein
MRCQRRQRRRGRTYYPWVRSWARRTVRLRVRADGPVINLYRMERAASEETEFVGYWTSDGANHLVDPWRQFVWVALGRRPRSYCAVRSEFAARPGRPPAHGAEGRGGGRPQGPTLPDDGPGTREPRRPIPPSLTGAAALPLPEDE